MSRRRSSHVWEIPFSEISEKFCKADCFRDFLHLIGVNDVGNSRETVKKCLESHGLDYRVLICRGKKLNNRGKRKQLSELLVQGSTRPKGQPLKNRLIAANLIQDICSECDTISVWNNKPLVLVLDHINGNPTDNRLENLRVLCPNCHSQTETFAGRNIGVGPIPTTSTNCAYGANDTRAFPDF